MEDLSICIAITDAFYGEALACGLNQRERGIHARYISVKGGPQEKEIFMEQEEMRYDLFLLGEEDRELSFSLPLREKTLFLTSRPSEEKKDIFSFSSLSELAQKLRFHGRKNKPGAGHADRGGKCCTTSQKPALFCGIENRPLSEKTGNTDPEEIGSGISGLLAGAVSRKGKQVLYLDFSTGGMQHIFVLEERDREKSAELFLYCLLYGGTQQEAHLCRDYVKKDFRGVYQFFFIGGSNPFLQLTKEELTICLAYVKENGGFDFIFAGLPALHSDIREAILDHCDILLECSETDEKAQILSDEEKVRKIPVSAGSDRTADPYGKKGIVLPKDRLESEEEWEEAGSLFEEPELEKAVQYLILIGSEAMEWKYTEGCSSR